MTRNIASITLALLACAAGQAATISTTLTVTNASGPIGATITVTGPATFTNGVGSGTFSGTLGLTPDATGNFGATYTITLTGGAGTITGKLSLSPSFLTGSGTGSATVTGGTGTYAGATGSFPSITGSGSLGASGANISFTGAGTITTGGPVGPTPPTITDVLDAASNTATVAQGSIFVVKGSNLCPAGFKSFDVPRPTVAPDGVKITFTPAAGGAATDALLWYEYNQSGVVQLAGILPSTVAPGNYNVTVTNGTASAPFATKVLASKFSLFTQDSSGTGMASVQNYISASQVDLNSFTSGNGKATTISPAHPGQFMLAYGTGMGPLVGGDNTASPAYDFSTSGVKVQAIVGGMAIPVAYAGRAGYAGEDQINFALPANVPTGCTVSLQISVNGVLSNTTFIAIAPDANATECVQPGFTTSQLKNFDQGASITTGGFALTQIQETVSSFGTIKINSAGGSFVRYTGYQLSAAANAQSTTTTSGACSVTHTVSTSGSSSSSGSGTGLDAGTVTLNGPAGSNISNMAFKQGANNSYSLQLATDGIPGGGGTGSIVAGQYTIAGAGGKDVGKFTSSITVGAPITLTGGLPATVNRSAGLPLSWTGGGANDLVEIIGVSSTTTGTGSAAVTDTWQFLCTTTAAAKSFTVPASVLLQLPAVSNNANGTSSGFLEFASSVAPSLFSAPLTAGGSIDNAAFLSWLGIGGPAAFQ